MTDMTNAEKRKEWEACTQYLYNKNMLINDWAERGCEEALRRYPDPKEPTIVTTENGAQYRIVDGVVYCRAYSMAPWTEQTWTSVSDLLALGELAQDSLDQQEKK